jgi:hypothetical protein
MMNEALHVLLLRTAIFQLRDIPYCAGSTTLPNLDTGQELGFDFLDLHVAIREASRLIPEVYPKALP